MATLAQRKRTSTSDGFAARMAAARADGTSKTWKKRGRKPGRGYWARKPPPRGKDNIGAVWYRRVHRWWQRGMSIAEIAKRGGGIPRSTVYFLLSFPTEEKWGNHYPEPKEPNRHKIKSQRAAIRSLYEKRKLRKTRRRARKPRFNSMEEVRRALAPLVQEIVDAHRLASSTKRATKT